MRVELLSGLERFVRRRFDRDLDQILAVGKSPLFDGQLMRKSRVLWLPAQHSNWAHDAQFSKIERTLVELAQEALLVVGEQLADGAPSLCGLVDFAAPLQIRKGRGANHMVADPIGLQFKPFQALPISWDGCCFHR